jgi:MoaA/NifB/PqqE/SkfB family radical SAM enzyme
LDRIGAKMPDDLMWRLVDEMSEWKEPFGFCPFKVNEPLLDKRLFPLLQRVEAQTIAQIRLFTNGQALTWEWLEKLHSLDRVAVLWVSLNHHIPEEYEKLMGVKFDRVAKNLDALHESTFAHPVAVSRVGVDP